MTSIIDEILLSAVMLNSPIARMLHFLFRIVLISNVTLFAPTDPHEKIKFKFPASSLLGVVRLDRSIDHRLLHESTMHDQRLHELQPRLQLQQQQQQQQL